MPATMRILGWKAKGLRCPDHEIYCSDSNAIPYPITLVQMPNGTGKTTTLTLLRAALSGTFNDAQFERQSINEFCKKGINNTNGLFEVSLLLNQRRATIQMEFDFVAGRVYYKTTYGSGQRNGFYPPADFKKFMNENFVSFYVFDGELAQHLLDRRHTDAAVVVEHLFQISAFDALAKQVDDYWKRKTVNVSATEERGLIRRQNRLKSLKERLESVKDEQTALKKNRVDIWNRLQIQEQGYNQEIKKEEARSEKLSKAEVEVKQLQASVREQALEVLDMMRDPHAISAQFARSMLSLKDGLDKVKLPESAAREFFEDLAEEPECVCGRPINDEIKAAIRARARRYLGSEDVALLNTMKTSIKDAIGEEPDSAENSLNERLRALSQVMGEEREASNELDELQLEAARSDPAIMRAKREIEELRKQLLGIDQELEKFQSSDQEQSDERTFGIAVIEKKIKHAEDKVAEITDTIKLKLKRDKLLGIITKAHEKARNGITSELCAEANERTVNLMPHNNITIDHINHCLVLREQEGGSVGETLSVAYAFLATLFHRSEHELPFVVDSPAGPIDLAVRPKIGELIPSLTSQFIAFTISSERECFVTPLKRASNAEIQFITVFRKGSTELEEAARAAGGLHETLDGMTVQGEGFFKYFQLDAEEVS